MVSLALGDLQAAYNAGRTSPSEVVKGVASQLKGDVAFLSLTPMETLMERCRCAATAYAAHPVLQRFLDRPVHPSVP